MCKANLQKKKAGRLTLPDFKRVCCPSKIFRETNGRTGSPETQPHLSGPWPLTEEPNREGSNKGELCGNGAGTTEYLYGTKGPLTSTSHPNTSINPRRITSPKIENIFSTEVGNGLRQDTESNNHKIDKFDFIEMKTICSSEDIIRKINRSTAKWEKISLKYVSDKRTCIQDIYKNPYNSI